MNLNDNSVNQLSYSNLVSIPSANQLNYTYDLTIIKYNTTIDSEITQLTKTQLNTIKSTITYQPATDIVIKSWSGGNILDSLFYTEHADMTVEFNEDVSEVEVELWGRKCNITSSIDKTATDTTLRLDSTLCYKADDNLKNKFISWYSKKYKYTANTRGEPLIKPGEIITLQSPFSEKLKCYVLTNNMSFGDTLSGDIELIAL